MWFEQGKEDPEYFNSERSADSIVEWIMKKTNPELSITPASCDLINAAKESQSILAFFSTGKPDNVTEYKEIFLPAAIQDQDIRFFSSHDDCTNQTWAKKVRAQPSGHTGIVLFRNFGDE
jgi:hypothetical protein